MTWLDFSCKVMLNTKHMRIICRLLMHWKQFRLKYQESGKECDSLELACWLWNFLYIYCVQKSLLQGLISPLCVSCHGILQIDFNPLPLTWLSSSFAQTVMLIYTKIVLFLYVFLVFVHFLFTYLIYNIPDL